MQRRDVAALVSALLRIVLLLWILLSHIPVHILPGRC